MLYELKYSPSYVLSDFIEDFKLLNLVLIIWNSLTIGSKLNICIKVQYVLVTCVVPSLIGNSPGLSSILW